MTHFEDEHAGTDATFSYEGEKVTHPMRTTTSKMPWHTEDKPFGMTQKEFEETQNVEPTDQTDGDLQDLSDLEATGETPIDSEPTGRGRSPGTSSTGLTLRSGARASRTSDVLGYCYCGRKGKFKLIRWYCQECWDNGDDADA